MQDLLEAIDIGQAITAIGAVIAVVAFFRVKVWPTFSKFKDIVDDLAGEPARPGVPARPGLMERMQGVENEIAATKAQASAAKFNTQPNGGSSPHDQLVRSIKTIQDDVTEVRAEIATARTELTEVARQAQQHRDDTDAWREDLNRRAAERHFEMPPWPWRHHHNKPE